MEIILNKLPEFPSPDGLTALLTEAGAVGVRLGWLILAAGAAGINGDESWGVIIALKLRLMLDKLLWNA